MFSITKNSKYNSLKIINNVNSYISYKILKHSEKLKELLCCQFYQVNAQVSKENRIKVS